ncbi:MAG: hydroxymethylbilane synthase [Solirubrobacterales bacterium]
MSSAPLRLGTRGSALALVQAQGVAEALGGAEVVVVKTTDEAVGDKARFVRGLQRALLAGEVDVAVHSAKDLPAEGPDGLEIAAVPARAAIADACCGAADSLDELPRGARIGTASLRRRSQLLALRPDLEVSELRGNVDTRLRKLAAGEAEAIVLAVAGLQRLGREREIAFQLTPEQMTPAPGQGALALEVRSASAAAERLAAISDPATALELAAERAAVAELGASCDTPVGVSARVQGTELALTGFAGLPDGTSWVRDAITRPADDPEAAGRELAERMGLAGATEILAAAEKIGLGTRR